MTFCNRHFHYRVGAQLISNSRALESRVDPLVVRTSFLTPILSGFTSTKVPLGCFFDLTQWNVVMYASNKRRNICWLWASRILLPLDQFNISVKRLQFRRSSKLRSLPHARSSSADNFFYCSGIILLLALFVILTKRNQTAILERKLEASPGVPQRYSRLSLQLFAIRRIYHYLSH